MNTSNIAVEPAGVVVITSDPLINRYVPFPSTELAYWNGATVVSTPETAAGSAPANEFFGERYSVRNAQLPPAPRPLFEAFATLMYDADVDTLTSL